MTVGKPRSAEMHAGPGFRIACEIERPEPHVIDGFAAFETPAISDLMNRLYTMANGATPTKIEDSGGNPMAVYGGDVYYNAPGGLKRAPVAGGAATTITASSVPYMSAIAVTDTEVFYATETCIFRQPK